MKLTNPHQNRMFFPRASERRVLPIVGVCKTPSHLHIFSSSRLLIFTSSHLLLIFSSSHLLTSSHLHIFSSSHLLIFTSSHLLTSSHIFSHLLTSSHLTSSPLALLPSCPSCPLLLFYFSSEGGGRGSANETARNATVSHETRFDRQKLSKIAISTGPAQPFRTKLGSIVNNCSKIAISTCPAQPFRTK